MRAREAALLASEQFALTQDEYAAHVAGRDGLVEKSRQQGLGR